MSAFLAELQADSALAHQRKTSMLASPFSTIAVVLYRLGTRVHRAGWTKSATVVQCAIQLLTGADIAMGAQIGPGLYFHHTVGVVIGPDVVAQGNLVLFGGVVLGLRRKTDRGWGFPTIGSNVEIFIKATVLGPIVIGDDVKIGAHALVLDDVAPKATVKGPCPPSR
jgi:serine O-acetyltransferase